MKPGDIIFCPVKIGNPYFYRVKSVLYGALGHQSLVEIMSLTEKPGCNVGGEMLPDTTTLVPEPLLREFTVYTPDISPEPSHDK